MEVISWVSAHAGQNHDLCLSAHGHLPRTLRYNNTRLMPTTTVQNAGNYSRGKEFHTPVHNIIKSCIHEVLKR